LQNATGVYSLSLNELRRLLIAISGLLGIDKQQTVYEQLMNNPLKLKNQLN
jgi:hypothetical protein